MRHQHPVLCHFHRQILSLMYCYSMRCAGPVRGAADQAHPRVRHGAAAGSRRRALAGQPHGGWGPCAVLGRFEITDARACLATPSCSSTMRMMLQAKPLPCNTAAWAHRAVPSVCSAQVGLFAVLPDGRKVPRLCRTPLPDPSPALLTPAAPVDLNILDEGGGLRARACTCTLHAHAAVCCMLHLHASSAPFDVTAWWPLMAVPTCLVRGSHDTGMEGVC
jgi:hypothetical protein